jgi:3-oxoadipate enol-lactonase
MKTADLIRSGGRIHYEVSGRNHGLALVLLHPLAANLATWQPQLAEFERFFRVLRIDLRGHGQSRLDEGPAQACTMQDLANDVFAVLDAEGIERAHWCGLSIGGAIALQAALLAPRRVLRLVLANSGAAFAPAAAWDERIAKARSEGLAALLAAVPERWFSAGFRAREPVEVARIIALFEATQPRGYIEACTALRDCDLSARLADVLAPTLVIAGALDPPPSLERAEQLAFGIAGADLVVLDAAHLSNVEQAADFTTTVLGFLRD